MKFDWVAFLAHFNIPYISQGRHMSQGWIAVNCKHPSHRSKDVDYYLGINPDHGGCHCWSCGTHSTLEVIQSQLGCTKNEALKQMKQFSRNEVLNSLREKRVGGSTAITLPTRPFTFVEEKFLKKRKISPEMVKEFDIRSGGIIGFFSHRIIFPIYQDNTIVSLTSRSIIKDEKLRYKTLPLAQEVTPHKYTLYNQDNTRKEQVIVVEGIIDCVRAGKGFVSTYGISVTAEQMVLLSDYDKVLISFDNDDAGSSASESLAYNLASLGTNVEIISIKGNHKDLGDLSAQEIEEIRQELLIY